MSPTPWKVELTTAKSELDSIVDFLLDHSDISRHLFMPILNDDRQSSLQKHQDRFWAEHTADPSSHWIFVRDPSSTTLKVIGACQWRFYESNPFAGDLPDLTATWWPEGTARDFTTDFIGQIMRPRAAWMCRPHVGMSWIAVRPSHRRNGIGSALMAWGVRRTDELGLESYIEGTVLGALLYHSCGFRQVTRVDFNMEREDSNDEWKDLERRILPLSMAIMWRPARGIWSEGEPQRTWKERLNDGNVNGVLSNCV